MFRPLQKLCRLQNLQNGQFHTSTSTPQTWSHFQFLRITRNSSQKTPPKVSIPQPPLEPLNISAEVQNQSLPPVMGLSNNLSPPQPSRIPRNRVFYSTCSDKPPKPPKKPDCTPKPKKCPEESSCSEKSYEKFCPDHKNESSCSTNKPKCPDKCPEPPKAKPKPCPPPEEKSICSKPKPKPKSCSQSEDRSICVKPPSKPSGCGGGKTSSRSYSSCTAAEPTDKTPSLTFGERQRRKIQEFCSRRKGTGSKECVGKSPQEEGEKAESFADKLTREKAEMTECLKKTTKFAELGYTRIHCRECIRDIITSDAKRFLRELDPYSGILHRKFVKMSSKPEEQIPQKKNHWIESILTQ